MEYLSDCRRGLLTISFAQNARDVSEKDFPSHFQMSRLVAHKPREAGSWTNGRRIVTVTNWVLQTIIQQAVWEALSKDRGHEASHRQRHLIPWV